MAWVKLDDQFFRHRKARAVGKDGRSLFLASCCYSAAGLTDGFIPRSDLAVVCADADVRPAIAQRLVDVGLWDVVDGGWLIHDFAEFNPTAEEVKERRRQAKERQERWRRKRDALRNASANAAANGHPQPVPSRRDKGRVSEEPSAVVSPPPLSAGDDKPETRLDDETVERGKTSARALRSGLRSAS